MSEGKELLGPAKDREQFWMDILEYEAGAWVVAAFASLAFGALEWVERGVWIAGIYAGSGMFAGVGFVLLVAGFIIHRRRHRAGRAYLRLKHGPGEEW